MIKTIGVPAYIRLVWVQHQLKIFLALFVVVALMTVLMPTPAHAVDALEPFDQEKTYRVLSVGDSITYGIGDLDYNAYRRDLKSRLNYVGFKTDFVGGVSTGTFLDSQHEGHPGWEINQSRAEIYEWMALYDPDIVLVHLGTNDIGRGIDLPNAADRLNALITQIRNAKPGVVVFVMKITGFLDPNFQYRADQFNAKVGVMSNIGSINSVYPVDQSAVDGLMLWNNNHPNSFGYNQMGFNLYTSFRRVYSGNTWPAATSPNNGSTANVCKRTSAGATICYTYVKENGQWVLA